MLNKVTEALALIRVHDPARYRQVIRDLKRVWIMASPAYSACYHPNTSTCELNERFVLNSATTAERIASSIVHEATHARLHGYGIGYVEKDRVRIEGICIRREMAFARKLPEGTENWQQAETKLDNLPDLSDKAVGERNLAGLRAALLYLDAPKWLTNLIVSYQRWRYRRRSARQKIN